MWLFTREGFLSVVQHWDDPETLIVRSRFAGQIEKIFPQAEVLTTPEADYLYRAFLPRQAVAAKLAALVAALDYPNFKGSLRDARYHAACREVWTTLNKHQRRT